MTTPQVDQSRRICDAVAGGELDVAIIGGEVPDELQASLKAVTYAEDQLVRFSPLFHFATFLFNVFIQT